MIRTFGSSDIAIEIVGRVAGDEALRAPVIRQPHLMDDASVDAQRRHPRRHQRARFDRRRAATRR